MGEASTIGRRGEVCRLIVTFFLLCLVGFLYYCGFFGSSNREELALAMTNLGSVIIGAVLVYWFRPLH